MQMRRSRSHAAFLGRALEAGLREMAVKRKRTLDFELAHYGKRHAIRQRVSLVRAARKFPPRRVEQRLVHLHEPRNPAREQRFADLHRLGVVPAGVKESHNFIEHLRCGNKSTVTPAYVAPHRDCGAVVLIVSQLQCDQKPGVDEIRGHDPL